MTFWSGKRRHATRLCFVGWGNHVHTERWVAQYVRPGYDVSVISMSAKGNYPAEVRQYSLGHGIFKTWRVRQASLRALLAWIMPDIVHVQYAGFLLNVAPIWKGPLVVTVWGSDVYRVDDLVAAERTALAWYLREADYVTCDSADLVAAIQSFCAPNPPPIAIVQWGVDTTQFRPSTSPSRFARELGLTGRTVFLSPRGFTPLYRLTDIVDAFAQVSAEIDDAVLLMKRYNSASSAAYAAEIERRVQALDLRDRVYMIDRIDYADMVDYYRSGRILVSVPESDGTPMSLLEGMACGCYPIVSDVPSLHEWIRDGDNGRIVPIGNTQALARAMIETARTPDLGPAIDKNLEIVASRASQGVNQEKMLAIYSELLERRATTS